MAMAAPAERPIQRVLPLLRKVKRSNGQYVACCPAHEDREPSLSVKEGNDGRVVFHCHAGCDTRDIVRALGLQWADVFPPKDDWRLPYTPRSAAPVPPPSEEADHGADVDDDKRAWPVVATYQYDDVDGNPVLRVHRKEPRIQLAGKPRKTFAQERWTGAAWAPGLDGMPPESRPLYHLPELYEALAEGQTVLVVEGEKDVETAARLGRVATCNVGGSNGWRPEYGAHFRGADVVVLIDNDDPGRAWAADVGASLAAWGATPRLLALPIDTPKADLTDWVAAGGTTEALDRLIARAKAWRPGEPVPTPPRPSRFQLLTVADLEATPELEWLVGEPMAGVMPAEALLAVFGAPGAGKSFIAADLACTIASRGPTAPPTWFGNTVRRGPVLYVAAEGGRGFRQRVLAWRERHGVGQPDLGIHWILEPVNLYGADDVEDVLRACETLPAAPALVVFDTVARCLVGGDENSAQDMGLVIDHADRVKRETGASVLLVHHARKDGDVERGSGALRAGVDTLALCREDEESGGRVLTCEKQKDADPFAPMAFRLRAVGDSCVVTPHDPHAEPQAGQLTPNGLKALGTLIELFPKGATATQWLRASDVAERTFYRVIRALVKHGYASESDRGGHPVYHSTDSGRWAFGSAR